MSVQLPKLKGSAALLRLFADEGVTHVFGNPGTTELAIMSALPDHPQLKYVLGLQEAGVVAMADGYARASRRLAVANVHVAPGLGNAIGSLYAAKLCGSPVVLTAGQQEQGHGLREPLLSGPLVEMAQPLVKWAVEVTRIQDLARIVHRAAKIALAPPAGPVFISLPGDILDDETELDLGRPVRVEARSRPADDVLESIAAMLLSAKNPVIVAGREIAAHDALAGAAELAALLGAAVYEQTIPYGALFPSGHRAYMGPLSRSQQRVRSLLEPFDLMLCLGSDLLRMSIHSPVEPLPQGLPVVHISERDWELGKNYATDIAVCANIKETLRALLPLLAARRSPEYASQAAGRLARLEPRNWSAAREDARSEATLLRASRPIDQRYLAMCICDALPRDAVVVEEAVSAAPPLAAFLSIRGRSDFFAQASGGLGFGIPGAVGVSLALPGRPVTAVVGDGAAMYGIQGLWTAAHLDLPITYVIFNNRGYRILKERLVASRGTKAFVGMELRSPEIDFAGLAQSLGVTARQISDPADITPALEQCYLRGRPALLDVRVADGFEN